MTADLNVFSCHYSSIICNMRFSTILGSVLLAVPIQAAKLLICSDSTTANYATGNALQG